jgi:hypothetical protein
MKSRMKEKSLIKAVTTSLTMFPHPLGAIVPSTLKALFPANHEQKKS